MHDQNQPKFDFHCLTPDKVLDAVEHVGIFPDSGLLALNSYENRVYQFRVESGRRYVTKFYRPQRWTKQQILEEHDFAFELNEAEVPVAAPLRIDGQTLFEFDGYYFALWDSVGGREFEVDNFDQLEAVGRFLGRLHQVGQNKVFCSRPTLSLEEFGYGARELLLQQAELSSHVEKPFFVVLDQVLDRISEPLSMNRKLGRIHGDMHPGNILWLSDSPSFVDLDDARNGPPIQDLWMMLNGDHNSQLCQLDVLLEGYNTFAQFDDDELKLIEPLRALRMINYLAWLTKRWVDPAFPRNFPWFGDDKFWEQQILALKEQLAKLDEAPLSLTLGYNR